MSQSLYLHFVDNELFHMPSPKTDGNGLKINILNSTDFDTEWLHRQIKRFAERLDIVWEIYFYFVEQGWKPEIYPHPIVSKWMGLNNLEDEFICQIPKDDIYPQFIRRRSDRYSVSLYFRNKTKLCKYLIAHELCHVRGGHPFHHNSSSEMEDFCDLFAGSLTGCIGKK